MSFSNNDSQLTKKTILVAPLDWGLGHATRCIPVIKELQNYPLRIIIAADGAVETLLKQEFPHLQYIQLPGYGIKYSTKRRWFRLNLLVQVPKIIRSVMAEHRWLKKAVRDLGVDAVVSDNRFGLYNRSVCCIYITHQLFLKTGNSILDAIASKIHSFYSKNYTQCWIPDFGNKENFSGELSHKDKIPSNAYFIGCLSRFERKVSSEITVDLLIILSGPEPQRTIFENILLNQLAGFEGRVMFVRGLPGKEGSEKPVEFNVNKGITIKNHLDAAALNEAILQSSLVISRSGYTTVMDLAKLRKKAVLVPTPGQTEQEYLADYLLAKQLFYTAPQVNFDLKKVLEKASLFDYQFPDVDMNEYKNVIRRFVEKL